MKILLALDSFKGSLSSKQSGEILARCIKSVYSDAETEIISVADGGEGSLEMIKQGKILHSLITQDPLGREIQSYFLTEGGTAFLEMATTYGLTLLSEEERNPLKTSTFGLGQQILAAASLPEINKIVIFAGGSATNDMGLGALEALGFGFFNLNHQKIRPVGTQLSKITHYSSPTHLKLPKIVVATDVTNPLCGENGATYVFGPQKGANKEQLQILELGLQHMSTFFSKKTIPGLGAAGGLAAGFYYFLDSEIISATDLLFKMGRLPEKVTQADLVITGEGRIDHQTFHGKLVSKIMALSPHRKFIWVAGQIKVPIPSQVCFSVALIASDNDIQHGITHAETLLEEVGQKIGHYLLYQHNSSSFI